MANTFETDDQRRLRLQQQQLQFRQDMARQGEMQAYEVQGQNGRSYEAQATRPDAAANATKEYWAQHGGAPQGGGSSSYEDAMTKARELVGAGRVDEAKDLALRALQQRDPSELTPEQRAILDKYQPKVSRELTPEKRAVLEKYGYRPPAPAIPTPAPNMSLLGRLKDNVIGVDDGVMSPGEKLGSLLNKAGESMTMGVIGDEAGAAFDAAVGRGSYEDRRDHYRRQEAQVERENPYLSIGADISGALIGPGKGAAGFVNAANSGIGRILRGAIAGAGAGAVGGAMEGETAEGRLQGAARDGAIGLAAGGTLSAVGQGFNRASRALSRRPELREAIPTLDSLRDEAKGLYAAAERSGAALPRSGMAQLRDGTSSALKDAGYHPRLHPKLSVVLGEIDHMAATDQPLQRLEQLRRMAGNAASSLEPDERRLASMVIDKIDDAVDGMGDASAPLKQAREVWSRMRRMEAVEAIIEDASNSPNFEQALQTKFRALLRNPRRMRGFSQAERDAMGKIARGTATVKSLKSLGSLMAPNSIFGAMLTGGAAYATGPAAAAIPAVGLGSKAVANAMIRSQAEGVRRMAGMDDHKRRIIEALLGRANPLATTAGASGTIGGLMGYRSE
ncbi:hypothetical protein [Pseudooceanicola sp. MF1-13]|uniref:hypothetical protein n=1 Tax=Pseudooceanicola sp. MF1-13 TaxID=3379095 RepID=UPI003891FE06